MPRIQGKTKNCRADKINIPANIMRELNEKGTFGGDMMEMEVLNNGDLLVKKERL